MRSRCQRCAAAAGWTSVAGNLLLAIVKWFAGFACNSQALRADALHSSVDVLGSVITLIMLKLSHRRPSAKYPYGLAKLEDIAALAIYLILVIAGTFMVVDAIHSIATGDMAAPKLPALFTAIFSIAVNMVMYYFISCAGRHTGSPSLVALGYENRVDALSSVASSIGILGATLGYTPLDPIAAIIVSLIIIVESVKELYHAARRLTDAALPPETCAAIERAAAQVPHVCGVMAVKTRRLGPVAHADLDILVDREFSVEAAQAVAQMVAERVRAAVEELGEVCVFTHPAPVSKDIRSARLTELFTVMRQLRPEGRSKS